VNAVLDQAARDPGGGNRGARADSAPDLWRRAMLKSVLPHFAAIALLSLVTLTHASPPIGRDIEVHVERDGATFRMQVEMSVAARVDEAWEVLTDFEKMHQILSTVETSKVIKRTGNQVEVMQVSHGYAGPLRIAVHSVRQEHLFPPNEIRSRQLSGDLKASNFTTRIVEDDGVSTITVDGSFVIDPLFSWAVTTDAVEAQTRSQYRELRNEILRRRMHSPSPACALASACGQGPQRRNPG
jgi:hypothetical protein